MNKVLEFLKKLEKEGEGHCLLTMHYDGSGTIKSGKDKRVLILFDNPSDLMFKIELYKKTTALSVYNGKSYHYRGLDGMTYDLKRNEKVFEKYGIKEVCLHYGDSKIKTLSLEQVEDILLNSSEIC